MRERKEGGFAPPALGGASLLVIFAVLALTIFALLSLSTVRADGRLSEAAGDAVKEYYEADCAAQAVLAWLRTGEENPLVPGDLALTASTADPGGTVYAYTVPISGTQELRVEVRVDGADDWEILRWQAVPVGDWEADNSIELWDMMF